MNQPRPAARSAAPSASAAMRPDGFRLLWTASLLLPLLLFGTAAWWSWRGLEAEARARLSRTVDMLHEHALRSFETQEAILEAAERRSRGMSWEEIAASRPLHEFLAGLAETAKPTGGMVLVDPQGRLRTGSFRFPSEPVDVSDRDYLQAHRAGAVGTYIGSVILARPLNVAVFSISRRKVAADGSFDGVVVSSFRPGYFESFYRAVAESPGDVVALLRDDGALLARHPEPPSIEAYRTPADAAALRAAREGGSAFSIGRSPIDGSERMYQFRRVDAYPVFVVYGLDPAAIRSDWGRQLATTGAICVFAALLLGSLTARASRSARREQAALETARLEAERRADAEARLSHTQRVETLGQIVGGVAHDFNNVLMSVQAGTRRLRRGTSGPEETERIANLMDQAIDRGARLAQRMLTFARRDESRPPVVAPEATLRSVADLLGHTLGSGYRIAMELPQDLPAAAADPTEFETALVNLIINARDAMPDGGVVRVEAVEDMVEQAAEPTTLPVGRYLRVTVSDDGIGMNEEILARASEAFFTTKPPGQGTGLGLAMARGFAERSRGAFQIRSAPGEGTAVTLWLPVLEIAVEGKAA
jgi:two-component system, NtrC family, sensor kinase